MEKDRGTRIIALVAIFIGVITTTICFASFSTMLNIEGTGVIKNSSWIVVFENLSAANIVGNAREINAPAIQSDSTLIGTYNVELSNPGDSISYTFDIKNKGTHDAKITAIGIAGLGGKELTFTGGDSVDQENVKNNISYTLTYADGEKIGLPLEVGDILPKKETNINGSVKVRLTLSYANFTDMSLLPKETVTIGGLDVAITYGQASVE